LEYSGHLKRDNKTSSSRN